MSFQDVRDAEDAKQELNRKNLGGLELTVEWSKKSGRAGENEERPKYRQT